VVEGGVLVVQRIRTVWTKESRGGAGAQRRSATPTAFALPRFPAPNHLLVHEVDSNEATDFAVEERDYEQDLAPLDLGWVVIESSAHQVGVRFASPSDLSGEPRVRARDAFTLDRGQWGRVAYNLRHTEDRGWWYEQVFINVAAPIRTDVDRNLFVSTNPTVQRTQLRKLW
jgi:hypothetical protein